MPDWMTSSSEALKNGKTGLMTSSIGFYHPSIIFLSVPCPKEPYTSALLSKTNCSGSLALNDVFIVETFIYFLLNM